MKKTESSNRQLRNANFMFVSKCAVAMSSTLRTLGCDVKLASALTLLVLGPLLGGCVHQPTQPCPPPTPITLPALSQPLPSVSYSLTAQKRIAGWQKTLDATSPTSKP